MMTLRHQRGLLTALAFAITLPGAATARDFTPVVDTPPSEPLRDGSTAGGEASVLVTGTVPSDLNNPDLDVVHVKCRGRTTICADVADTLNNDNTFHVAVLCLVPRDRRGRGELELAVAPGRPISESACITECREALVTYQSDFNDFSDSSYDSVVSCGSKAFSRGYPRFPQ